MTWNIHGALGHNPRFDLVRVVELIRRWAPDIVALQEVDSRRKLENGDDPFVVLQDALGQHGIRAESITTADGVYGQMLISCCPFRRHDVLDISRPEREPRRAIWAEIETPAGLVRVVATHLGLSIRERRGQARQAAGADRDARHDHDRDRRLQRLVLARLGAFGCWRASCRAARATAPSRRSGRCCGSTGSTAVRPRA